MPQLRPSLFKQTDLLFSLWVLFLQEVEIYDSVHIGQANLIFEVVINCVVDLGEVYMVGVVGIIPVKQVATRGHHLV